MGWMENREFFDLTRFEGRFGPKRIIPPASWADARRWAVLTPDFLHTGEGYLNEPSRGGKVSLSRKITSGAKAHLLSEPGARA
jgi:hypothetical protein